VRDTPDVETCMTLQMLRPVWPPKNQEWTMLWHRPLETKEWRWPA
jgi:hypothetical protein